MKRGIFGMRALVITLVVLIAGVGIAFSQPYSVANTGIAGATAYNNGRRMVRCSNDMRHLVYEDSGPRVMYTRSPDGINWSTPVAIADGWKPSIAIDQENVLGVVFSAGTPSDVYFICSTDRGITWSSPFNVSESPDLNSENPAIAHDYFGHWHVVWQEEDLDIWWRLLEGCPDIGADPKKNISQTPGLSEYPSIANTIDYSSGNVHVSWYDFSEEYGYPTPFIAYRTGWQLGATGWRPALGTAPLDATCGTTGILSSISVGPDDNPHVVWQHTAGNVYHATSLDGGITFIGPPVMVIAATSSFPLPSVANVTSDKLHVTWEHKGGEIHHSYSTDDGVTWGLFQLVSNADGILDKYANLAYKKVLHDFADIVWTNGNSAPYTVMYLRKAVPVSAGAGPNTPSDHERHYDPTASPYNEMLQIKIPGTPSAEDLYINTVTLVASGSGDDKNGVSQVLLIHDADGDGKYDDDDGETQLATETYSLDNGTLVLNVTGGSGPGGTHTVTAGTTDYLLVVYTIDWSVVKPGDTFTFQVTAIAATGATSGQPISVGGLPINAATKTIVATVAPPDTWGVFRNGMWFLDKNGDGDAADVGEAFYFGNATGDTPLVGDWNGNGTDTWGVFRAGAWFLDINGDYDAADAGEAFGFGNATDTPLVGDWSGNGTDTWGVFRNGTWYLDKNGDYDAADTYEAFGFGNATDTPLVGDWNGDGTDTWGVFRAGAWFLDINGDGDAADTYEAFYFGNATDTPLVGDWNGDGTDTWGVFRAGVWYLDINGDYDAADTGEAFYFGSASDIPLVGHWQDGGSSVPMSMVSSPVVLVMPNPVTVGGEVTFQVMGAGVDAVKVLIYDLGGGLVYQSELVSGQSVTWDLRFEEGTPVANGIYLYSMIAKANGELIETEIGKLLILR